MAAKSPKGGIDTSSAEALGTEDAQNGAESAPETVTDAVAPEADATENAPSVTVTTTEVANGSSALNDEYIDPDAPVWSEVQLESAKLAHEAWVELQKAEGWIFGVAHNAEAKVSPLIRSFLGLTSVQKIENYLSKL